MQLRITHNTLHFHNFPIALPLNSHVHVCINFTSICYQHRRHSTGQPLRPQPPSSSNNPIPPTRPPSISINPCALCSPNSIQLPSRSPSPTLLSHYTHYHNNCRPSQNSRPSLAVPSKPSLTAANLVPPRAPLASEASLQTNHTCASRNFLRWRPPPRDLGNVARIYVLSLL